MKKFYALSLCILIGVSSAAADSRFKTRKGAQRKTVHRTETSTPIWRAGSTTDFAYEDGEWIEIGKTFYKYDSKGNKTEEKVEDEDGSSLTQIEYNGNNLPVSRISSDLADDDTWTPNNKIVYVYDAVIPDFVVERNGYDWTDGAWVSNYFCETNVITRNEAGNIIEIVKSVPLAGELTPAFKSSWNYNATTGKADEFRYYSYESWEDVPGWALYNDRAYRNIIWENTNGQMTASSMYEYLQGANRVKSCEVYVEDVLDGHFLGEYNADKPADYLVTETFADPTEIGTTTQYETTDANGSFRVTYREYFETVYDDATDAETVVPVDEPTYESVEEVTIDNHGNVVLETFSETFDGITEMVDGSKSEYTYNDEGNPTELVISYYDYDLDEYVPSMKLLFEDYADVSAGIDNVTVDSAKDGFTVYNIQGIMIRSNADAESLKSLAPGLYIINGRKHLLR